MILPTKHINEHEALIGVGAIILKQLSAETDLSVLWDDIKENSAVGNYERFILGLNFLFLLGLINIKNNKITQVLL